MKAKGNAIIITKQASGTAKIDALMAAFNAVAWMVLNLASSLPSIFVGCAWIDAAAGCGCSTSAVHLIATEQRTSGRGVPGPTLPKIPLGLPKALYAVTTSLCFTVGNLLKAGPWLQWPPPTEDSDALCLPARSASAGGCTNGLTGASSTAPATHCSRQCVQSAVGRTA